MHWQTLTRTLAYRYGALLKGNVAVCTDLNIEFVTKNSFRHKFAARNAIKF